MVREATTAEAFFHRAFRQSRGPDTLPAATAELPGQVPRPYPGA
ncbi:MAG TPA: hypothetical protein VLR70_15340 [Arthrobacter sp.]|nr:hypothetical protein [Arthrobacter sp.]